jgi:Tol biopolymer transport system component
VVATDDIDRNPQFSRDGTLLAFLRQVPMQAGNFDLVVARSDGNAPRVLTPVPVATPEEVEWAPDGRFLLVNEDNGNLTRFFVDGSPPEPLLQGVHIERDAFRPPDGAQILYERDDDQGALYLMNLDATNVVQLFGARTSPCACALSGDARWSSDGRHVALAVNIDGLQQRIFTIGADGQGFSQLAHEDGLWIEADPTWSPDGTRIAFNRWQGTDSGPGAGDWPIRPIAIVDAHGGVVRPLGVAPESGGAWIEWAPDGKSIMSLPTTVVEGFTWSISANGTVAKPTMLDLETGGATQIAWSVGSVASWQRQAP